MNPVMIYVSRYMLRHMHVCFLTFVYFSFLCSTKLPLCLFGQLNPRNPQLSLSHSLSLCVSLSLLIDIARNKSHPIDLILLASWRSLGPVHLHELC